MGQVERQLRTYDMVAVRHTLNRDVFYLDTQLTEIERQIANCDEMDDADLRNLLLIAYELYMKEMLSHGCS